MNDKKLEKIINQMDKGCLPDKISGKEAECIALLRDLKTASGENLEPDPDFINRLEEKILKGGETAMKNLWQKVFSLPVVLGGLAVFVLFIMLVPNFNMPLPGQMLRKYSAQSDTAQSVGSISSDIQIMPEPMPGEGMPYYPPFEDDLTSPDRYVVQSGNLNLEVKDVSQAVDEGVKYVESIGGLVTNSSVSKTEKGYTGYLTVRVPEKEFSAALKYFKRMASTVKQEYVSAYDETGQVTNAEERLEDLKAQLEKYESLMVKAQTSDEKLKLQRQIDQLNSQIKSWEKQNESLKGRAAMSEITVSFEEDKFKLPLVGDLGLGNAVDEAVWALKRAFGALIILGVWVVVFSPIWLPVFLIVKWLKKRK